MKNFSITTKAGDGGDTSLLNSARVSKTDPRPEAYGTLDEANAFLGLAKATSDSPELQRTITLVQNHLYLINAELACPTDYLHLLKRVLETRDLSELEELEKTIESSLKLPRKFVLYGTCVLSAQLDTARAMIRRAERRTVELHRLEPLANENILPYLNRLSDVLFLLARRVESDQGLAFDHPTIADEP
ncbi:cob(I)yrinic acid a,c-diamide adenosyltransferase [candidate division KSB1 bacterium]|nr:cob(I)yrinic acid a,c-diamide adenosyltransferase [candidate division KSB1 bacterium]